MKNSTLIKRGALNAVAVTAYVFLVALFMNNASRWFGEEDNVITPVAVLLLFLFSALVTSCLVLGKPLLMYLDGQKKEALKLLFYTGAGIFTFLIIVFIVLMILN